MSRLTTERRKKLPSSTFALPGRRAYPMDSARRAANAKGRAKQQYEKGNMSSSTLSKIVAKANKVLKKKK